MALLNYTSQVPAHKSIAEISQMLARAGAKQIMHDYDDNGYIVALSFSLDLPMLNDPSQVNRISFRLPTDWRPVQEILVQMRRKNTKLGTYLVEQDHALNVAWRITKDWVEAQLAIIETRMVTTAQLFLPYAITKDGDTLYQHIAKNTSLLLGEGRDRAS